MGPYSRPIFYDYQTLSQSKWLENHTLSSGTYPYSQYMRVHPPPGLGSEIACFEDSLTSLDIHLVADDSNLLFCRKTLTCLEKQIINTELAHVETWLNANKLSLSKSNFVLFYPSQKTYPRPINSRNNIMKKVAVVFLGSIFLKTVKMHSQLKSLLKSSIRTYIAII